jgi:protein involved in polysaccharide export with SLBB domain
LPPYTVAPPDILLIDTLRVVPRPPYKIEPLDALFIHVTPTLPNEPITGIYAVEPDGNLNLGPSYGSVRLAGLTLAEAKKAVEEQVKLTIKKPLEVTVSLAQSRAMQQIRGEHLVRPDGTISLGLYGSVYVAGLTLEQVKAAVESHLADKILDPEVSVDVYAYNSRVYYVIFDLAGSGEQVVPLPSTGNETVLDALSKVGGLTAVSSNRHIWVARPAPADLGCRQILPVNWEGIVRGGETATNYQILPGDRIYVQGNTLVKVDTGLARLIAPIERLFGIALLGDSTVITFKTSGGGTGGTGTIR